MWWCSGPLLPRCQSLHTPPRPAVHQHLVGKDEGTREVKGKGILLKPAIRDTNLL